MVRAYWIVIAALCSGLTLSAWGQAPTLPENWRELGASEFATALEAAAGSNDVSAEVRAALDAHAWERFLADPGFIAQGEWPAVVKLVRLAAGQAAGAPDDFAAKQVELKNRLAERYATDRTLVENQDLYDVGRSTKSLGATGFGPNETAEVFLRWMENNDWRSMEVRDLYNLYSWINVDSVDRTRFSARWTGSISPPASSSYTFRQLPAYAGVDSRLRLFIDNELLLDSSDPTKGLEKFESRAVALEAGRPVSIRVELVHDGSWINFSEGAPMAAVTWQRDGQSAEFIPSSALSPPAERIQPTVTGLWGEYFRDTSFREPTISRIDSSLDLIWSWPPAASIHHQAADDVFQLCVAKSLDENFLQQTAAAGNQEYFYFNQWRLAFRMSGSQRQQLVGLLARNPALLLAMNRRAISKLMQGVYMLPGKEHVKLLGEWSLAHPQPRNVPGQFPGWGYAYYQQMNTDYYWLMGTVFGGPYWSDVEQLWDEYLIRPDGECNLPVAYASAFAAGEHGSTQVLLDRLQAQVDDATLTGDQRMTWLVAQAFAREVQFGRPLPLHPLAGRSELETAIQTADSPTYKAWAVQELASRLISLGQADQARELLQQHGENFVTAEQKREVGEWLATADRLVSVYQQQAEERAGAQQAAYRAELTARREAAAANGDSTSVARFDELLQTSAVSSQEK